MKIKLISVFVLLITILSGCSDSELNKVSLMLDYTPNTNHIGFYVADYLGFYEDNNIKLDIIYPGDIAVETMVATGDVDFGISYQENLMMARDNNLDITSIMSIIPVQTSGFYTYQSHENNVDDLLYCGWGTDIEYAILDYVASEMNIDNIDKQVVDLSLLTGESSECDIFWEFENWGAISADLNGIKTNYYPLIDYGLNWYTPILITSEDLINNDPILIKNFVEATIKGYKYAFNNIDEAIDIFLSYNPEIDKELVTTSLKQIDEIINLDNFGYQDEEIYINFSDFLVSNNIIENGDINNAFTNEFLN